MNLIKPTDSILHAPSSEVSDIEKEVTPNIGKMKNLMENLKGVGLAAPQIGIPLKFFVSRLEGFEVVINSKIVSTSGDRISKQESCLSWPNNSAFVARHDKIKFEWTNLNGERKISKLEGMPARIFQHENDHLNGVCIFPKP